MSTTFPTDEMILERGVAMARMAKMQREEVTQLRRELEMPIWRDWLFWLGLCAVLSKPIQANQANSNLAVGLILLVIALDRVARKRSRAAHELSMIK